MNEALWGDCSAPSVSVAVSGMCSGRLKVEHKEYDLQSIEPAQVGGVLDNRSHYTTGLSPHELCRVG